jgi:hypothetical protein
MTDHVAVRPVFPRSNLGFVFPSGFETFFHDFVGTGGGSPDPHRMAQMAKDRGVTLLGSHQDPEIATVLASHTRDRRQA